MPDMPAVPLQTYLGDNANPHKLIRERKRKLEVLRAAAASTGRVHEDLAVNLGPDLAAVRTGAADVVKFQEQIAAMERENEELAKEVSAVLDSPELASALANPLARANVASGIPDRVGEELLSDLWPGCK